MFPAGDFADKYSAFKQYTLEDAELVAGRVEVVAAGELVRWLVGAAAPDAELHICVK